MHNLSLFFQKLKGGPGSGNWGHAGIPGHRGGSAARSFAMSIRTGRDWQERQQAKKKPAFELPVNKESEIKAESYVIKRFGGRDNAEKALNEFKGLLKDAPVCMRVPEDVLDKILTQGEFKNQHQTGTSKGWLNPEFRKSAEKAAFGEQLTKPEDFPLYGYFATGKNGYPPSVSGYGSVKIEFKEEVKARSTVTAGDSLASFEDKQAVGTPANNPRLASLDNSVEYKEFSMSLYAEAQIHGKVVPKDIAKVIFTQSRYKSIDEREALFSKLREAGIPYEIKNELFFDD